MDRIRAIAIAAAMLLIALLAGCAAPSRGPARAPPKPVQLLFNFKSQGSLDAQATQQLVADVTKTVATSGLFSSVSSEPVPDGALLSIVIDHVPVTEEAFAKGVMGGVTFGAAEKRPATDYLCTLTYLPGSASMAAIQTSVRQVDEVTGASMAAGGSEPARSDEVVKGMARRIVDAALRKLELDSRFGR